MTTKIVCGITRENARRLRDAKYILFQNQDDRTLCIFPASYDHSAYAYVNEELGKPIHAGFINYEEEDPDEPPRTYGKSFTLGIKSSSEDDGALSDWYFKTFMKDHK